MADQPKTYLHAGNTALRSFQESDLTHLAQWWDNPTVTELLEMGARPTRGKDLQAFWRVASESEDAVVFSICERETGRLIGTCGLYLISWTARRAQFNILIGETDSWGKGFGAEATALTVKYGFERLNLESINLGVNTANAAAIKTYEKAGFVHEGTRRKFVFCNGKYYDSAMYSILKSEFEAAKS